MQYFIRVINVNCKLNRQKVNEYIIHIEIMKFAIYAKSAQLNSVFCLDFEFFHNFPPSRVVLRLQAFIWYYSQIWPVWLGINKEFYCHLLLCQVLSSMKMTKAPSSIFKLFLLKFCQRRRWQWNSWKNPWPSAVHQASPASQTFFKIYVWILRASVFIFMRFLLLQFSLNGIQMSIENADKLY